VVRLGDGGFDIGIPCMSVAGDGGCWPASRPDGSCRGRDEERRRKGSSNGLRDLRRWLLALSSYGLDPPLRKEELVESPRLSSRPSSEPCSERRLSGEKRLEAPVKLPETETETETALGGGYEDSMPSPPTPPASASASSGTEPVL
jgi:hypothetical protein